MSLAKWGSPLFHINDLKDPASLAVKLRDGRDLISQYLQRKINASTQRLLDEYDGSSPLPKLLQEVLINELNGLLMGPSLFNKESFAQVCLTEETQKLIAQNPQGEDLIRLNRLLLEEAYPHEIAKIPRWLGLFVVSFIGLFAGGILWVILSVASSPEEAVFLLLCIVGMIGGIFMWDRMRKYQRAKRAQQWSNLSGIVSGILVGDNLTGTYHGFPVAATVGEEIKTVSVGAVTGGIPDSYYVLKMFIGAQGKDWSLEYKDGKFLDFGARSWHIVSKDGALTQRLVKAGVVAAMGNWRRTRDVVVYDAKQGLLMYVTRTWFDGRQVPSPEDFKAQLRLLMYLANINKQVNVA